MMMQLYVVVERLLSKVNQALDIGDENWYIGEL